jgi:alkaline phosphatase D
MRASSRRTFLKHCAIAAGALAIPRAFATSQPSWRSGDPFSLGVAAGSPATDGFVIWTRLAPQPLSNDPATPGGIAPGAYTVDYTIATDPELRSVVRTGHAAADPRFAYSVHVEIGGLDPGRPYWYRFTCGDATSRIGRAITLQTAQTAQLKLGYVSCSNYEHGYFAAYRHLADEAPDLAIFLGDYIYEYIDTSATKVRTHSDGVDATTLPLYRNRYAQYRTDPDLQRLHAEVPALMTWDDHEVQNDYASQWSQTFDDPTDFLKRRAAAYQAYYEHMPLRARAIPNGPDMLLYDRYRFGDLAEISLLDGRQYRSREACQRPPSNGGAHLETDASCAELRDPTRSLLGTAQEAWLYDGLAHSPTRWNLIAQDVLMTQLRERNRDGAIAYWTDDWNGYPAARTRLMTHVRDARVSNPVVLSGDIHSFWANDLKVDYDDPAAPVVGTEFVGTSVSAHPPPYELFVKFLAENPQVKFFESRRRGYATLDVTPDRITTRFRALVDVTDRHTEVNTLKSFVVENGRAGAIET